jgi:integrase
MRGYVAQRRNRFYAVIYQGIDPITGREHRRWHPAGTDRGEAEELAAQLAAAHGSDDRGRRAGPTLGVYLTRNWLPMKQLTLRPSTWDSYRRNVELHVLPELGRVPIRRLRVEHLERLCAKLLDHGRADGRGGLDAKTVLEIHMVLRRALTDAQRRGMILANPAAIAHAPKRRPLASATPTRLECSTTTNVSRLQCRSSPARRPVGLGQHRRAPRGAPRSPLGRHRTDTARMSVSRALVSVGYEVHESRGKTRTARRCIDLDQRTVDTLRRWRERRRDEDPNDPVSDDAHVFATANGRPIHPHLMSDAFQKLVKRSGLPRIRLHDLRHTHATLLLKAGVPIKVVSERLGHATPAFTMTTYQHVLPGMQAEAAQTFAELLDLLPASTGFLSSSGTRVTDWFR